MENETDTENFPLSEELIVFCNNKEAQNSDFDMSLKARISYDNAKDLESFKWCLTNLHDMKTEEGKVFAISNIHHFIYSSWHQIPEDIYPLLIEELFTKIWEDGKYQDKKYHIKIYQAQNLAVFGLYPKYWPDFFDFLLKLPKPNLYGFLSSFNYSILDSATPIRRNVDELKNNCLKDGSQAKILQTIVNDVLEGVEEAGPSLVSTVEWASLSLVLDSDLVSVFAQLLSQSSTCSTGLNIFITIFHRPISQDVLFELITQLQLNEIIQQILSSSEGDEKIIVLCSTLLYSSYSQLISSQYPSLFEIISKVTETAMNLFMYPNSNSTSTNKLLLINIFSTYPTLVSDYFPMMIEKISSSIALNSEESNYIVQYSLDLLFNASRFSEIDIIPHLVTLSEDLDPNENISEIATLLASLNCLIPSIKEEEIQQNLIKSLAEIFSPLLSIQPPFFASHFIAMSNYLQIIDPILSTFDTSIRNDIFLKCIELIHCKECEITVPNDREMLLESIYNVCIEIPELIAQIPDIKEMIPDFIQSDELYLIKSASLIVSALDSDDRIQIYSQVLQFFAIYTNLSIAPQQEKSEKRKYSEMFDSSKSSVWKVLQFMALAKTSDLEPLKPLLMEFFSTLYKEKNSIFDDADYFAFFCKSSIKALGFNSFEIFWGTSKYITEFENAAVIVEASLKLAENPPYDENLKLIFQLINNTFTRVNSSRRLMKLSNENLQMNDFCKVSADFLMLIIPNLNQEADEADISTSVSILVDLLISKRLSNSMMNKIILFFLENPPGLASKSNEIFYSFMNILDEYRLTGDEEQRELLTNFMMLLKKLKPLSEIKWESTKWQKFLNLGENGPKIMEQLMTSNDEDFEPMMNEFLDNVEPQKVHVEEEFDADAED